MDATRYNNKVVGIVEKEGECASLSTMVLSSNDRDAQSTRGNKSQ